MLVRPSDCGLVLGVPLSREAFVEDLERGAAYDLAASIRRRSPVRLADAWRLLEERIDMVRSVAASAERAGVEVAWQGGLAELRSVLARRRVVTVLAHARPVRLTAGAIVDAHRLAATLEACSDQVARCICRIADCTEPGSTRGPLAVAAALRLLSELAFHRVEGRDPPEHLAELEVDSDVPIASLTRAALEVRLPTLIRPAPTIELRDGLHPVADLIAAIPTSWDGILDLSLFRSAFLEAAVARGRPGVRLIVDRDRASINVRLARYRVVVHVLGRSPGRFTKLFDTAHHALAGGRF